MNINELGEDLEQQNERRIESIERAGNRDRALL